MAAELRLELSYKADWGPKRCPKCLNILTTFGTAPTWTLHVEARMYVLKYRRYGRYVQYAQYVRYVQHVQYIEYIMYSMYVCTACAICT